MTQLIIISTWSYNYYYEMHIKTQLILVSSYYNEHQNLTKIQRGMIRILRTVAVQQFAMKLITVKHRASEYC